MASNTERVSMSWRHRVWAYSQCWQRRPPEGCGQKQENPQPSGSSWEQRPEFLHGFGSQRSTFENSTWCRFANAKRSWRSVNINTYHIDLLVQEKRNSCALAMELRLPCINPPIYSRPWGAADSFPIYAIDIMAHEENGQYFCRRRFQINLLQRNVFVLSGTFNSTWV